MKLGACLIAALAAAFVVHPARAQDAETLRAAYAELGEELATNVFGRPLYVSSSDEGARQHGEVYAALAQPFGTVARALRQMEHWCDILMLQANVTHCETASDTNTLSVFVNRKPRQPLDDAHRLDLGYEVAAASDDYLRVALGSPSGPLGTHDYRIRVEAASLDPGSTFLHLSYSYAVGLGARLAMGAYLATSGRHKVGFSVVDRGPDGEPVYIDGVRGVVERNAMRLYLAVEAYLGAVDAHPAERLEHRLRAWYAAIERYPEQLREQLARDDYLRIKRREALRRELGVRAG